VLRDGNNPASRLTRAEAQQAITDGSVTGGMIAKFEEAMAVIDQGIGAIHPRQARPGWMLLKENPDQAVDLVIS